MKHAWIYLGLVALLMLTGCTPGPATITMKPGAPVPADAVTDGKTNEGNTLVEGRIVSSTAHSIHVRGKSQRVEIPRESIEEIDHPGPDLMWAGGAMVVASTVAIGLLAWKANQVSTEAQKEAREKGQWILFDPAMPYYLVMMVPIATGITGTGLIIAGSMQKSRSEKLATHTTVALTPMLQPVQARGEMGLQAGLGMTLLW